MRKYLLGTGIIGAVSTGWSLLRGATHQEFTWRVALSWAGWAISMALSIGMIRDIRRASQGQPIPADSPIAGRESKYRRS
ncbi:hypothetical protein [Microbacterium sp. ZXX196]|uniref:hypothetical protein n=1 Tax=Microbacterium sp. ZXX196 TaxID=2609291 RepID=UPI0012B88E43|nr:hypothetical protein [Microbacterium sp. ZXX196]MTE24764.1 hypothetical protein [Microbacterium sp. ZXX196]